MGATALGSGLRMENSRFQIDDNEGGRDGFQISEKEKPKWEGWLCRSRWDRRWIAAGFNLRKIRPEESANPNGVDFYVVRPRRGRNCYDGFRDP